MPIPHLPLLASVSASPAVESLSPTSDPISFQTALLVIIAGAVLFLAKNLAAVNQRLAEIEADAHPKAGPPSTSPGTRAAASSHDTPLETVAAIVAAVHSALGSNHRILRIGGPATSERQAWSMEGRRQVFQSHKVR